MRNANFGRLLLLAGGAAAANVMSSDDLKGVANTD